MFVRDPLVEHAGKLGHMDSLVVKRLDGGPKGKHTHKKKRGGVRTTLDD